MDNLKEIAKVDKEKMRDILISFPSQCRQAVKIGEKTKLPPEYFSGIEKVIVCGMGGSGIGGEILKTLLLSLMKIPLFVNRDYNLPKFVNRKTLIFVISYSGNTEETLSIYEEAKKMGCYLIAITSGGKLKDLCGQDKIPLVTIPSGMPPRTSVGYLFLPMLKIMEKLISIETINYDELYQNLIQIKDRCSPSVSLQENLAKSIAYKLKGKIPIIYGVDGRTDVVAHRLKTQLNENSKILAFWDVFPELNHNEVVGWDGEDKTNLRIFYPIFIRDKDEPLRISKRIHVTQDLIKRQGVEYTEIWAEGESLLTKIFSSIYIGDWVSFYLAILRGIDPTPVKAIELLKKELSR
ncbi:bifunctional phosphoglucose/phosphomannose isomerase [Candidatus Aerophobetes bacterium]|nr:bifunctional phosphoglucose/phosphomannose isomerase [Candidatus Aerophobetes bacterium]